MIGLASRHRRIVGIRININAECNPIFLAAANILDEVFVILIRFVIAQPQRIIA